MMTRTQVHIEMSRRRGLDIAIFPSDAIRTAFDRAADTYAADPSDANLDVCCALWEVLLQQGCEHIDGDGSLTHLIDILIRG